MSRSPFGTLYKTSPRRNPFGHPISSKNPFKGMGGSAGHAPAISSPAKKSGGGGGGILGGIEGFGSHLVSDVANTVTGIPAGLVHLARHPIGGVEQMAKSTWADWSPLFHSEFQLGKAGFHALTGNEKAAAHDVGGAGHDFSTFGKNFYAHPLAPILDVASLVTGGASLAGKAAAKLGEAGLVSDASKLGKLGKFAKPEAIAYKHTDPGRIEQAFRTSSGNPLTKTAQLKVKGALDKFGPDTPVVGSNARYARQEIKMMAPRSSAFHYFNHQLITASKRLTGADKTKFEEASLRNVYHQMGSHAFIHTGELPATSDYVYLRRITPKNSANFFKRRANKSFEEDLGGRPITRFGKQMRVGGVAQRFTTRKLSGAVEAGAGSGKYYVVPRHFAEKYGLEGANSSKFLKTFVHAPTTIWKYALLGYSPRFFVNNSVGNMFMYALGHEGGHGISSLAESMAHGIGERKSIRAMVKAGSTKDAAKAAHLLNPGWMDKHFRDQLNNTFALTNQKGMGKLSKATLYPVVHKYSDQLTRRAALRSFMKAQPEVKAVMKGSKISFDKAAMKALDGGEGRALRARATQHVTDIMGDYHSMNPGERRLASVMPFYTWNRHAVRFTGHMARDHPGRLDAAVHEGQVGNKDVLKLLGHVPSWLLNSIPGSMIGLGSDKGRTSLLGTQGLNPLATTADITKAAAGLSDMALGTKFHGSAALGDTLGSELNPIVASLIEHLSGHSLSTDAPVKGGSAFADAFKNIPQLELLKALQHGTPQPKPTKSGKPGKPFLFEKNAAQYLDSVLGAPIRQMNKKKAEAMYKTENGIKSTRKTSTKKKYRGL